MRGNGAEKKGQTRCCRTLLSIGGVGYALISIFFAEVSCDPAAELYLSLLNVRRALSSTARSSSTLPRSALGPGMGLTAPPSIVTLAPALPLSRILAFIMTLSSSFTRPFAALRRRDWSASALYCCLLMLMSRVILRCSPSSRFRSDESCPISSLFADWSTLGTSVMPSSAVCESMRAICGGGCPVREVGRLGPFPGGCSGTIIGGEAGSERSDAASWPVWSCLKTRIGHDIDYKPQSASDAQTGTN